MENFTKWFSLRLFSFRLYRQRRAGKGCSRALTLFLPLLLLLSLLLANPLSARRLALVIGVNYKGNEAGIPPLEVCEKDAKLIERELKRKGKFDSVAVLLGRMVTAKNVGNRISRLTDRVKAEDTVVIYFSGHGTYQKDDSAPNGMRNFIIMYQRPHLPDNLLDKWVRRIKTKNLVWVFDSCYSGGIAAKGRRSRGSAPIPISRGELGRVIENGDADNYFGNRAIIGSSAANQTSIEVSGNINHGIFTYHFSRSLAEKNGDLNRDGTVTVLEAFEWTKPRVEQTARRYKHTQTPTISGNASGIAISGRRSPKPPKPTPLTPAPPPAAAPLPAAGTAVASPTQLAQPVTAAEPQTIAHSKRSSAQIYTTIFESTVAGPTPLDPRQQVERNRRGNRPRRLDLLLSGKRYPFQVTWISSSQLRREMGESIPLGVYSHRGRVYKNRVARIRVKNIPTGLYQVELKADGYPLIKERLGVEKIAKNNRLFVVASLAGYGTIRGKVFYKTFDRPLAGQKIWLPTIKETNQIHNMTSTKDGSFWFLNLLPGDDYYIRASFAENSPLDNKKLRVQANTVTNVDVVLSRKVL